MYLSCQSPFWAGDVCWTSSDHHSPLQENWDSMEFRKCWPIFFSLPAPGGPGMCTSIRFSYQHLASCWCNEALGLVQTWPPVRSRGGISDSEMTWRGRWDTCADLNEVHIRHSFSYAHFCCSHWLPQPEPFRLVWDCSVEAGNLQCSLSHLLSNTNIENREVAVNYSPYSAVFQLRIICLIWKWVSQR